MDHRAGHSWSLKTFLFCHSIENWTFLESARRCWCCAGHPRWYPGDIVNTPSKNNFPLNKEDAPACSEIASVLFFFFFWGKRCREITSNLMMNYSKQIARLYEWGVGGHVTEDGLKFSCPIASPLNIDQVALTKLPTAYLAIILTMFATKIFPYYLHLSVGFRSSSFWSWSFT